MAVHRVYQPNYGRWLTPDPGGIKVVNLADPQTWNMYAYVTDNPTTLNDPTGLGARCTGQSTEHNNVLTCEQAQAAAQLTATLKNSTQERAQQQISLSSKGLDFIRGYEKLRPKEYLDQAGNETIGYGHKILPGEDFSKGITNTQALTLLKTDIQGAVGEVNAALNVSVKQNQFDALVSLAFNAGPRSVLPGNEMMRAVNGGNVGQANFTAYDKITVGRRLVFSQGLFNRRVAEYQMYTGGGP